MHEINKNNLSTNFSEPINANLNTKNNIAFFLDFTTGQKFIVNGNPFNSFRLTLNF